MLYKPVWSYVPMHQYSRPGFPAGEAVRKELVSFWHRMHPVAQLNRFKQKELRSIPPYLLDRAAPAPAAEQNMCALQVALQNWRQSRDVNETVQVIVDPPGSGGTGAA